MRFFLLFPFLPLLVLFVGIAIQKAGLSRQRRQRDDYLRSLPQPRERLPDKPACPRCRSGMARGYLLDRSHAVCGVGLWIEGEPEPAGWPYMVRPRLERSIPIVSYRCTGCGYLELYARPELVAEPDRNKPAAYPEL